MIFNVNGNTLSLDKKGGKYVFISHAHTDHTINTYTERLITSNETYTLANLKGNITIPNWVELYNAGHIIGAKQIAFEVNGKKIVYTGDLRLKKGIFGEYGEIVETDVLYIDATFGNPIFKFPEPMETYEQIIKWVKENENNILVFGAYPIGKTQELVKMLNEYGYIPILQEQNYNYTERLKKINYKFDMLKAGTEESMEVLRSGGIIISPVKSLKMYIKRWLSRIFKRKVYFTLVTGWKFRNRLIDRIFPLSDHSDFNDIVKYIEYSNAKKIIPLFGKPDYLKQKFKDKIKIL